MVLEMSADQHVEVDVAVIGAGPAGLYTAYRLLTGLDSAGNRNNVTVALFEAEGRVGGRVHSIQLDSSAEVCELGAMRYLTTDKILSSLVETVFADKYSLTAVDTDCFDSTSLAYHCRSQLFRHTDIIKNRGADFKCFSVGERWRGMSLDDILEAVFVDVLRADGYSLQELQSDANNALRKWNHLKQNLRYRFKGPHEDQFVYQMSFGDLLHDQLDDDTVAFVRSLYGYDSAFIYPAADIFQWFLEEGSESVLYKTIKGGLESVMRCLAQEITEAGGKLFTHNTLRSFSKVSNGQFRYELTILNRARNATWKASARDIILCIPRRGLEQLDRQSVLFSEDTFQRKMCSVIPISATKVVLGFREVWWNETVGARGKSVTDLPIRQSYYYGLPEGVSGTSTVLASYADHSSCKLWQRLQNDGWEEGDERERQQNEMHIRSENAVERYYEEASPCVIKNMIQQLRQVHGENVQISQPCVSAFKDWSKDPHGGGYHCWKPGIEAWKMTAIMRRPLERERIFIAGEAYSDRQGWVEGAFRSAEQVVRQWFSLAAPEWLNSGEEHDAYYLGW